MPRCVRCGKNGVFVKINQQGLCEDCERIVALEYQKKALGDNIAKLNQVLSDQQAMRQRIYDETVAKATADLDSIIQEKSNYLATINETIAKQLEILNNLGEQRAKIEKQLETNQKKLEKINRTYKSIEYAINNYFNKQVDFSDVLIPDILFENEELLHPTTTIKLHSMDVKQLRTLYNQNYRAIQETLTKYQGRYNTKANMAIYQLMVIALESELQNVLYNIKYGTLESAVNDIKTITAKYLSIATNGNQAIAPTITKFIGEIEYLFVEAIKIEYEYYIQKERIKEEQRALKEQARQEEEEQRALEIERTKIEAEEAKFNDQITSLQQSMQETDDQEKLKALENRIEELQKQLAGISDKKEEIVKLQNGKAGYVYIISNLGSFGDNVFKIGMTRRMEPQERVNELGDASVPFSFDVHSFIFSDDAVGLEHSLHTILNDRRVNKVNLRKEFFNITIDELENLVFELQPTAEFNRTMLADQYYQTLAMTSTIFDEE